VHLERQASTLKKGSSRRRALSGRSRCDNAQQFLVQNPIHRYAIGDRDKLKFDADGSLPIYIQSVSPGQDKESNWLPTPRDSFNLFMRMYWPTDEVLNGRWTIPPVERVHD